MIRGRLGGETGIALIRMKGWPRDDGVEDVDASGSIAAWITAVNWLLGGIAEEMDPWIWWMGDAGNGRQFVLHHGLEEARAEAEELWH